MIVLVMVRRAQCEVCLGSVDLPPGSDVPTECAICGSKEWQYGPESRESRFIRQGIKYLKKRLNPGAKSKKRQDRAKKQWRQFKSKAEN